MWYAGSEAYDLNAQELGREQGYAPELVSFEGGSADARAREGVSAGLGLIVARGLACLVALFAVGCVSVALTWGTVSRLQTNSTVSSAMVELEAKNGDMRMECARLARAERVTHIATQSLGMVYASDAGRISVEND